MVNVMNWEQKLHALNSLAECKLIMRKPGDWYVSQRTEVKRESDSVLTGKFGNGPTPQAAVDNHWQELTGNLDEFIVLEAYAGCRRHVQWNGFMWIDLPIRKQA
jgi:hypothetical protein